MPKMRLGADIGIRRSAADDKIYRQGDLPEMLSDASVNWPGTEQMQTMIAVKHQRRFLLQSRRKPKNIQ